MPAPNAVKKPEFQTPQEKALEPLFEAMQENWTAAFEEGNVKLQKQLEEHVAHVKTLSDDVNAVRKEWGKRLNAQMASFQRGDALSCTAEEAQLGGEVIIETMLAGTGKMERERADDFNRRASELGIESHTAAAASPQTGPGGGLLVVERAGNEILKMANDVSALARNIRVSPPVPILKKVSGYTVHYPDLGEAPAEQVAKFAKAKPDVTRVVAYAPIDRAFLKKELAIPLFEYVRDEIAYGAAEKDDYNLAVGAGGAGDCRITGVFNRAGNSDITCDAGDNTFAEAVAANLKYLGKQMGAIPRRYWTDGRVRHFMSASVFFEYFSLRDSQGRPLINLIAGVNGQQFVLAGVPVEIVHAAPRMADSGASKALSVLGNVYQAIRRFRDPGTYEFRTSEHYRFLQNELAVCAQWEEDTQTVEPDALSRQVTNAA